MTTDLKQTAMQFYDLAFNQDQPREAVERYVGDPYTQHNPTTRCAAPPGSAAGGSAGSAPTAAPVEEGRLDAHVIMIIRHGEKPPESGLEPYGITSDGTHDPNALTPFGWARAGALVELFAPSRGSAPAGLMRPQAVFASRPEDGQNLRESETVSLIARRLGVPVEMPYVVGQEAELAATLRSRGGPILVAWNHTRITEIPEHLGTVRPRVPPTWPDERFDMVYVLQGSGPGTYALTQVPQLLLPGDDPAPIA